MRDGGTEGDCESAGTLRGTGRPNEEVERRGEGGGEGQKRTTAGKEEEKEETEEGLHAFLPPLVLFNSRRTETRIEPGILPPPPPPLLPLTGRGETTRILGSLSPSPLCKEGRKVPHTCELENRWEGKEGNRGRRRRKEGFKLSPRLLG